MLEPTFAGAGGLGLGAPTGLEARFCIGFSVSVSSAVYLFWIMSSMKLVVRLCRRAMSWTRVRERTFH